MATGKPKSGAGPYAGYKKNYAPIKSSKGTKAEKVVGKVLAAAGGGVKPQKVKVAGKTMTTKPVESGLGVVGTMARAAARAAASPVGKSAGSVNKTMGGVPKALAKKARETRLASSREMKDRYSLSKKEGGKVDYFMAGRGASGTARVKNSRQAAARDDVRTARMAKDGVKSGQLPKRYTSASVNPKMKPSPTKGKK
jgi:hypothetical protein